MSEDIELDLVNYVEIDASNVERILRKYVEAKTGKSISSFNIFYDDDINLDRVRLHLGEN